MVVYKVVYVKKVKKKIKVYGKNYGILIEVY